MGLSHRLELRQSQSLALTPQLLQAIRLLQLSHIELASHVEAEIERNPLLDYADTAADHDGARLPAAQDEEVGEWSPAEPQPDRAAIEADFGTSLDNLFHDTAGEAPAATRDESRAADEGLTVSAGPPHTGTRHSQDEGPDLEATLAAVISLHDHLLAQFDLATDDPQQRLIGRFLIDAIDGAGYLTEATADIAARLGVAEAEVLQALALVQGCEPTGAGARDLAECLALQLRERDRFDPAMEVLVANLPLVARHDHAALRKLCGVDQADLSDMLAELRRLDPKPARAFDGEPAQTLIPDVLVRQARDGSFIVELNEATLPRVLLNRAYHAQLMSSARSEADRVFLSECLQGGDWLTRSLEQRARTVLKVASEIVRQQAGFFTLGAAHLRPLTLKAVADAIGMHESTVSRVSANKAIGCERGILPMKFFFSAAVTAAGGGETLAAEAVRHRIRQLIAAETAPRNVMSDDALVRKLHEEGIEIARRTVAKYRESLRLASSVERRRALAARAGSGA